MKRYCLLLFLIAVTGCSNKSGGSPAVVTNVTTATKTPDAVPAEQAEQTNSQPQPIYLEISTAELPQDSPEPQSTPEAVSPDEPEVEVAAAPADTNTAPAEKNTVPADKTKETPATTNDKELAEAWLKQNLPDGAWQELKWWTPITLQALYDARLQLMQAEVAKSRKQKAAGDARAAKKLSDWEKLLTKLKQRGVRRICGMKFRTKNELGANVVREIVFDTTGGKVSIVDPDSHNSFVDGLHNPWQYLNNPDAPIVDGGQPPDVMKAASDAVEDAMAKRALQKKLNPPRTKR